MGGSLRMQPSSMQRLPMALAQAPKNTSKQGWVGGTTIETFFALLIHDTINAVTEKLEGRTVIQCIRSIRSIRSIRCIVYTDNIPPLK